LKGKVEEGKSGGRKRGAVFGDAIIFGGSLLIHFEVSKEFRYLDGWQTLIIMKENGRTEGRELRPKPVCAVMGPLFAKTRSQYH